MGGGLSLHRPELWEAVEHSGGVLPAGVGGPRLPPFLQGVASGHIGKQEEEPLSPVPEGSGSTSEQEATVVPDLDNDYLADGSELLAEQRDRLSLGGIAAQSSPAVLQELEGSTTRAISQRRRETSELFRTLSNVSSTFVSAKLGDLNESLVEGDALSYRGVAVLTTAAACSCWALRLMVADVARGMGWMRSLSKGKRLVIELYFLGALHAGSWTCFVGKKLLKGDWDSPEGTTRALSLSAGFYWHELIVLRSLVWSDPLLFLHRVIELLAHASMLRSPGTQWLVPVLMAQVAPMLPLDLIRVFHILGLHPGTALVRAMLALYIGSFVCTSTIAVPAVCIWNWAVQPKPELHQPRYLLAKVCLVAKLLISHYWFAQTLRGAPEVLRIAGSNLTLKQLRDVALQPLSMVAAAGQLLSTLGLYVVGPVSLPLIAAAFRRGLQRIAIVYSVGLGILTFAPIPKKASASVVRSSIWQAISRLAEKYFSFKVVTEVPLEKEKRYLAAVFPHGIMPIGIQLLLSRLWQQGHLPNFLGASILFKLPVLRQVFALAGGVPATKRNMRECLQRPFPHNVTVLVPGGIGEMFYARQDVEHILADHKGFCRTALQSGVDLLPVYILGHTQIFRSIRRDSTLGRLCEAFSRWARASVPIFHGRWGTPMTFSIPYPHPLVALIGKPIPVGPPVATPSQEQIDKLHARFFAELSALFHKHKAVCPGYEDKELYLGSQAAVPAPPREDIEEFKLSKL